MIAHNCITDSQKPIFLSQKVGEAMEYLEFNNLEWVVIVDKNQRLMGYFNYKILCTLNPLKPLHEYINTSAVPLSIPADTYWLQCLHILNKTTLNCLAVVNPKSLDFKGIITKKSILNNLYKSTTFNEEGAWIWLKILKFKFSLADLDKYAKINGISIDGFIVLEDDNEQIIFNIKTKEKSIKHYINSLQNIDYEILGSFMRDDIIDDNDDKFNYLLTYLDL